MQKSTSNDRAAIALSDIIRVAMAKAVREYALSLAKSMPLWLREASAKGAQVPLTTVDAVAARLTPATVFKGLQVLPVSFSDIDLAIAPAFDTPPLLVAAELMKITTIPAN